MAAAGPGDRPGDDLYSDSESDAALTARAAAAGAGAGPDGHGPGQARSAGGPGTAAAADSSFYPPSHPLDHCPSVDDGLYEGFLYEPGAEWEFEGEEPGMQYDVQSCTKHVEKNLFVQY